MATNTSKHFLVQRDIAPVWDLVEARIRSDAVYGPSFYVLLNVTLLIAVGALVLRAQRIIWRARERPEPSRNARSR
jgi:hypothetical protein